MTEVSEEVRVRPAVQISVHGSFGVSAPDGTDLTPKPHKSRALIALLALSPDMKRSRRWIEERLWSDRAPQQAAGSLRQALVDVRKSLAEHSAIVEADREWVWFAPDTVKVLPTTNGEDDFLEGINVRDPAFGRWVEAHRETSSVGAKTPVLTPDMSQVAEPDAPITIRWGTSGPPGTGSALMAEIVAARIADDISDHVTSWTVALPRYEAGPGLTPDIDVTCDVIEDNGICLAFIKIIHVQTGRVLFAKDFRFVGTAGSLIDSELLTVAAFEAAEKVVAQIPHVLGCGRATTKSAALGQLAMHKIFSFETTHLEEADQLLSKAYEMDENCVFLAWRGFLRMIKSIEFVPRQSPELRDMAEVLTSYAMEKGQNNPTAKALVAQTRAVLIGDLDTACTAASQALDNNPRNPFALQAMSVAKMRAGDAEQAYQLSLRGRAFASKSSFRHWWDANHCAVCTATGRVDEAIAAAEAAAQGAPSLRPAYRFLIPLYAHRDQLDKANTARQRLTALEPGFTLDRMLKDHSYPVRTLRSTGLLESARKLL